MQEDKQLAIVQAPTLDTMITAWLDAKFHKSNSSKTFKAYQSTLAQFRAGLQSQGLDLDAQQPEAQAAIALTAQAFSRFSATGRDVKRATINQRLAILGSFYKFACKYGFLSTNPIERLDRAKVEAYEQAQPLSSEQVTARLAAIDRSTTNGKRDYALLCVAIQTGRRLQEILTLDLCNLTPEGPRLVVAFENCKGGKRMLDTLPPALSAAVLDWIATYYGDVTLPAPADTRPLWVSLAHNPAVQGQRLGQQSVADICQRHLGTSKFHATRHTFAHGMDKAGASVATIQARLGHASLATTGRYLAQLKRAENPYSDALAALFGIE